EGPGSTLSIFGGIGQSGALRSVAPGGLYGPAGIALTIPASTLTALQTRSRTRLLASSQIHVIDGEQHTIRIGQRVPIKSATFLTGNTTVVNANPNNPNN